MRLAPRTWLHGLVIAGLMVTGACLFSTNPPKPRSTSGSGSSDPNAAIVTGAVQFYDRTDHHTRNMPDWVVRADWYIRTGTGLRHVQSSVVRSNPSGVYEVQFSDPALVQVVLQAVICNFNVNDVDCCLDLPPCTNSVCAQLWITPVSLQIGPGSRQQRTLTVPCDHVP
jgi:hypothetical protein